MPSLFAGRIGVVIETAPGHFTTVVMRGTRASIEREMDDHLFAFGMTNRYVPPSRIKIELEGYVTSEQDTAADDAAWVTDAAPELDATRRELEA